MLWLCAYSYGLGITLSSQIWPTNFFLLCDLIQSYVIPSMYIHNSIQWRKLSTTRHTKSRNFKFHSIDNIRWMEWSIADRNALPTARISKLMNRSIKKINYFFPQLCVRIKDISVNTRFSNDNTVCTLFIGNSVF